MRQLRRRKQGPPSALAALLALPLVLGGCVLVSPTDPYAGMPASLATSSPTAVATTAQPGPGPLSLDEAVRLALASNPELAATAQEVEAETARRDAAAAQRLPSLHAVGGYSHYLDSQRLAAATENGEIGVFSRDLISGDLVVSMPIFTGGRITSEVKAADRLRQATEHRMARTREELVFNVTSVFCGILAQRDLVQAVEGSRKALQEHARRIADMVAAQMAANVDRLRTEVRLADVEQRLVRERNAMAVLYQVLKGLLGMPQTAVAVTIEGTLVFESATVPQTDVAMGRALGARSDYLAARAGLEAQAKAVDSARAARWPTVALQGAYGGRWAADPTDRPSGVDTAEDIGRVGVVVDVPIFEGGRLDARLREQRARLAAAQERLRKLELQIGLEVETALLNVGSASQRVRATEKAIEQAGESLRIERGKYDLGKGAIVDVLDAQAALLESQTNHCRAMADYNTARAQLDLAMGEK